MSKVKTTTKPAEEATTTEETAVPTTDAADAEGVQVIPVTEESVAVPSPEEVHALSEATYDLAVSLSSHQYEAPAASGPGLVTELGISPVAKLSRTYAQDQPGPGGACHVYRTLVRDEFGAVAASHEVKFHKGALSAVGGVPNGIADSTFLSILAHRWEAFQAGPLASEQTEQALEHILAAIECLNDRTRERTERGVQGEHEK